MTTHTIVPTTVDPEVDFPNTESTMVPATESSFVTYGSGGQQQLNLVRIGKPKSIEANHPEVNDCLFWRYPTDVQPLYMPFRSHNGRPQNTFFDLQLVAIEDTIVTYKENALKTSKLNLSVVDDNDPTADVLTITCGLASNFAISVLQGLTTMVNNHPPLTPFNLSAKAKSTPRGTTHFAYISVGRDWQKNDDLFKEFQDLKTAFYDSELHAAGAPISGYPPLLSRCRELVAHINAGLPE